MALLENIFKELVPPRELHTLVLDITLAGHLPVRTYNSKTLNLHFNLSALGLSLKSREMFLFSFCETLRVFTEKSMFDDLVSEI